VPDKPRGYYRPGEVCCLCAGVDRTIMAGAVASMQVNFVNSGGNRGRRVRCVVQDVAVDVSSNQIRDLWLAAFLEEVRPGLQA
jgi:hypothetical protein